MTRARQALGASGEDAACAELLRRGYRIMARRYRTRFGEIDVVARDGRTVVFIEVKTRASTAFGTAAEAVTPHKQAQVRKLAADYLWRHGLGEPPCRFEVAAVSVDAQRRPVEVVLICDGFGAW
jgi:putative endonuclease